MFIALFLQSFMAAFGQVSLFIFILRLKKLKNIL